jgi:hypothetical protein
MLGKLGDAFNRLMKDDDRTAEEKARDQLRAERKVQRYNKAVDIECYFVEINKLKVQRTKLIKSGKREEHEAKKMTEDIAEGIKDLETEIDALMELLKLLGELTASAEGFRSRCGHLKLQEDTDGFEGGANVSINMTREESSELQDLNAL